MSPELQAFLENEWYGVNSARYVSHISGYTALHVLSGKSVEMVRELVSMMGDLIHHRSIDGETALHAACSERDYDVVVLLASHLDQSVQMKSGQTALHLVCESDHTFIPLLKWHEIPNNKGQTPIYWVEDSHIHTLAKLRRLFGTLPAAYIRLVHSFA